METRKEKLQEVINEINTAFDSKEFLSKLSDAAKLEIFELSIIEGGLVNLSESTKKELQKIQNNGNQETEITADNRQ
ncbi:Uncharacterised protein [Chryseobacterium taklimakanense]|uniref:Uncharacterized protein n=1 Tax=Chryseobacterium taklimakanense TaxID=536441 RepID=A0A239XM98_9FLAO|nr:hypothetical protein [Chryseobacterium taklimakanense]SNV48169.1 Uncharacterised protein [Chryseobacterium taklimakanense]